MNPDTKQNSAAITLAAVIGSISAIGTSNFWSEDPIIGTVESQIGKQQFAMVSQGQRIGTVTFEVSRNSHGKFVVEDTVAIPISPNHSIQTTIKYRFEQVRPYRLSSATFLELTQPGGYEISRKGLTRVGDQLLFVSSDGVQSQVDGEYSLGDRFVIHHRLSTERPIIDIEGIQKTVDWTAKQIESFAWKVESVQGREVRVVAEDRAESTTFRFDPHAKLIGSSSGSAGAKLVDLDDYDAENQAMMLAIGGSIPVQGSMHEPRNLESLTVRFDFVDGTPRVWQSWLSEELTHTVTVADEPGVIDTPEAISVLDEQAVAESDEINGFLHQLPSKPAGFDQVAALLNFVHDYVEYADRDVPQSIATTISSRRGDCSDIAALFSLLTPHLRVPSRVVYGLVYDTSVGAFRVHAWNEVQVNGVLRQVDPTFAQIRADATHIEFPSANVIEVLQSLSALTIHVVEQS